MDGKVMIKKVSSTASRQAFRARAGAWLLGTLLVSMACAQGTAPAIQAHGETFVQAQRAPKTQARIYAYRLSPAVPPAPINLYINGRYLASMLAGAYTEFCTPVGNWQLQTVLDDAAQQHSGKQGTGQWVAPQAGQVLYLRVQDNGNSTASSQAVPAAQALEELRRTRRQQHTLARAPQVVECNGESDTPNPTPALVATAPMPKPPQREYALETDALFEFGKTELRASGFNAIEGMVHKIQRDYSRIDRIRVAGFTDAIGPTQLNRKLALQRAQLVAQRLQERGLKPERGIHAEGHGATELVKTDCRNAPTPANKACHAPNRRVVIVVYGLRR